MTTGPDPEGSPPLRAHPLLLRILAYLPAVILALTIALILFADPKRFFGPDESVGPPPEGIVKIMREREADRPVRSN